MNLSLLRGLDITVDSAGWTEEQWVEHDAKIAAERKVEALCRACKLVEREPHGVHCGPCGRADASHRRGFPLRAIEAAQLADVTASAIVRVAEWAKASDGILVLSGSPGCGKTVAAAWWSIHSDRRPIFLRATAFATAGRYQNDEHDGWLRSDAMVLDDLGTEYADAKGSFLVDLDELIDTFYADKKSLLVTTNCTAVEFKQRYGARVADRIRECGAWFSISDESRRRKA